MTDIKMPTMMSIKEAAQKTNLPEYTIRKLVTDKKVPAINTGKKYYVNLEKFIEFLNMGEIDDLR